MTILKALQHYGEDIQCMRGYSTLTVRRNNQAVKQLIALTEIEEFSSLTETEIRRFFFDGRTNKHWQASTMITYLKSLKVFFDWCVKQGYLRENPVVNIEKPRMEKKIPPKLTKQEAMRLLEVVENYPWPDRYLRSRNHAILSTFIFTGLRKRELLNLKFTDVDTENRTVFVNQGKGSKDRIIPMSSQLEWVLTKYMLERKRKGKTCPELFTSSQRNTGFTDSGLKRMIDKIKETSGIQFTAHRLRHTFATLMLEGGCDIYSLSKMMGHSDIKTTTIYLAASAEHLREQITKHPLGEGRSFTI